MLRVFLVVIGVSLSEPHSNVENGLVVHAPGNTAKNGIATHYCGLVRWFKNMVNLRIHVSIQVLHIIKISVFGQPCMNNETAKITATPY